MKNRDTVVEKKALELFRIVQGAGDGGSKHAFYMNNPALTEGWRRLARKIRKRERKTGLQTMIALVVAKYTYKQMRDIAIFHGMKPGRSCIEVATQLAKAGKVYLTIQLI